MEEPLHVLDPVGDIILVLRNPNAPFAVWDEWEGVGSSESASATDEDNPPSPPTLFGDEPAPADDEVEPEQPSKIRFRLSSRHLSLASRYFEKQLEAPWKDDSAVSSCGCYYIYADDWDAEALLALVQIMHGRNRSVPRSLNLEMLAKIAVLVDYYECHEAVEVFSEIWFKALESPLPTQSNRDLILGLVVSWVFKQADVFETVTARAMQQCKGPLPTLDLPIPKSLVDAIDNQRQEHVGQIVTALHNLLACLCDGLAGCLFECSSILLGALTKQMHQEGILQPRPGPPYIGYSIAATEEMIRRFKSPEWVSPYNSRRHWDSDLQHPCDLKSLIKRDIHDIEGNMEGLVLEYFLPRGITAMSKSGGEGNGEPAEHERVAV